MEIGVVTALDGTGSSDGWAEATQAHDSWFALDALSQFMTSEDSSDIAQVLAALFDGGNRHEGLGAQPGYDMLAEVTGFPDVTGLPQFSALIDAGMSFFDLTTALSPPSFFEGSISHEFDALAHAAGDSGNTIFETFTATVDNALEILAAHAPAADSGDTFFFNSNMAGASDEATPSDFGVAVQIAVLDQHHLLSADDFSII